ncbi:hypothetical protein FQN57_000630 [Myotisia sp. PD_48]|nr:hypothetical protein FQN57_000630 [Myotisia sp. PD_48]
MIFVQGILLKIALDNRPPPSSKNGIEHIPFSSHGSGAHSGGYARPYGFWQWRTTRPYWTFLAYLSIGLFVIQVFLTPISRSQAYIDLLGYGGLSVEAFLPIPQIISNQRHRSCKGFRPSVLVSWLMGDALKMVYFFFSGGTIPWAFRVCAIVQCCCDCYLGIQYWKFEDGPMIDLNEFPQIKQFVDPYRRRFARGSSMQMSQMS